jgi:hypothetical protein
MFLAKTSRFIAIIVPLTDKTINQFRLIKPNSRSVPADSQVFIPNEQAIDLFTWYDQVVD